MTHETTKNETTKTKGSSCLRVLALSRLRMVLRDILEVALAGAALGLVLAASNTRVAQRFLYGISAVAARSLFAAAVLLLATALMSGYLPARRAAHVDPAIALRE